MSVQQWSDAPGTGQNRSFVQQGGSAESEDGGFIPEGGGVKTVKIYPAS